LTIPTRLAQIDRRIRLLASAWLVVGLAGLGGAEVRAETALRPLRFTGEIHRADDLSAIVSIGRYLVIASDEGSLIQVLEPTEIAGTYQPAGQAVRLLRGDREIDIEAMAFADGALYVLGSHSIKRKRIDPDGDYLENRARLETVSPEPRRKKLFRVGIDPKTGLTTSKIDVVSLETVLRQDPVLAPFTHVPAVENGINIEGMAVDAQTLYLGFRSPVLREGHVPVMLLRFDEPDDYSLRFLQLHGDGVRSLARVDDGFLVLAAPERRAEGSSAIYLWNGLDQVPGAGKQQGRLERLLELAPVRGGVPEGLTVVTEEDDYYEVIVLHDGIPGGHPLRMRLPRSH
jgi:hypothetical protein